MQGRHGERVPRACGRRYHAAIGGPVRYRLRKMPLLTRISIAPVKSLALQHPQEAVLEDVGVRNDRVFYLTDPRGRLVTGAALGPLVQIASDYDLDRERLRLDFPDGNTVEGDATAMGPPVQSDFYGRRVDAHVIEGPFARMLSEYAHRPVRLVRVDRAGDGTDVHHVTMVSAESVAELGRQAGRQGEPDARRFRMLLEISGVDAPHEEDSWEGREVRIGGAVIRVVGQVPRCVVTTQNPSTGVKDLDTLKTINRYRGVMDAEEGRGLPFGMYAEVETPGMVRVGDDVEPG
jgi:uncharacterized protein YcbX